MGNPRTLRYAAAVALLVGASQGQAETLACTAVSKYACTPEGCRPIAATVDIGIRAAQNLYLRCERGSDCDTYTFVSSGDDAGFRTFELPGRGTFAKVAPSGAYTEVASLGQMILITHGQCERLQEQSAR